MTLAPGTRLGPYEILAPLGAGGMGEVYRAKDPKLGREVAVKVLPEAFATDIDRLKRFEQEARTLSGLNHPNILTVFDLGSHEGTPYLVMELLEGETLREKMGGKPLPARKATEIALQVAKGLSAAHAQGILHRDLKPENLFLTKDGRVKILDFGLAKVQSGIVGSESATRAFLSEPGTVVGTSGYMSPEQVQCEALDTRSDLFSLGVVLWEMVSGSRPFHRDSSLETMHAILKDELPDLDPALQIPTALERILHSCLAKVREGRFHSAHDLAFALELPNSNESATREISLTPQTARWRTQLPWVCVVILAIALPLFWPRAAKVTAPLLEVELSLPPAIIPIYLAMSPDGSRLLMEGVSEYQQKNTIWTRSLDQMAWTQLPGSEGATYPFWSHDGHAIGFVANGKLRWIPAIGGTPQVICEAGNINRPGTWGANNTIVFTRDGDQPLWKVSAEGGTPQLLASRESGVASYRNPHFLPDGRHLLFNKVLVQDPKQRPVQDGELWGLDMATGKATRIFQAVGEGYGLAEGWVVVLRSDELVAQRMDLRTFQVKGESRTIASKVERDNGQALWGIFSISPSGLLVYLPEVPAPLRQFTWLDLEGHRLGTVGEPTRIFGVRGINLSPDGLRVAYGQEASHHEVDLWTLDLQRGVSSRLTFGGQFLSWGRGRALWSVDGREIYLLGAQGLLAQDASLASKQRLLSSGRYNPFSVTPDGKQVLLVGAKPDTGSDILALSTLELSEPKPFLATAADETQPRLSPDGRWLAYMSNESGGMEVFVVDYPGATAKVQLSSGGGSDPFWLGRSGALAYRQGSAFYTVSLQGKAGIIQVGPPRRLLTQMSPEMATQMALFSTIYPRLLVADPEGKRLLAPLMTFEALQPKTLRVTTTWMSKLEGK